MLKMVSNERLTYTVFFPAIISFFVFQQQSEIFLQSRVRKKSGPHNVPGHYLPYAIIQLSVLIFSFRRRQETYETHLFVCPFVSPLVHQK